MPPRPEGQPRETPQPRGSWRSWRASLLLGGGRGGRAVVGGEVFHVLVGQVGRDRAHGREIALPALVRLQRGNDIPRLLAAKLGNAVDLGKRRLPVGNAVASLAQGLLVLDRGDVVVRGLGAENAGRERDRGEDTFGGHGAGLFLGVRQPRIIQQPPARRASPRSGAARGGSPVPAPRRSG